MAALKRVLAQALSGALIEAGNVQDGSGVFDQKNLQAYSPELLKTCCTCTDGHVTKLITLLALLGLWYSRNYPIF